VPDFRGCKRVGTRVKFPTLSDPYARDAHRFESPQLHQEVLIGGGGFQGSEISRPFNGLAPSSSAKRMDIGVEGQQDASVWVSEMDLTTMIRNLVDNAIR
jgi:signal transduction histidine kinase